MQYLGQDLRFVTSYDEIRFSYIGISWSPFSSIATKILPIQSLYVTLLFCLKYLNLFVDIACFLTDSILYQNIHKLSLCAPFLDKTATFQLLNASIHQVLYYSCLVLNVLRGMLLA